MLRATHLSVGVAAALAVLQPDNLFECLAVTGIAAVGSVISDIDADQSKVRREADLMLGIGAAVLAAVMIAQTRFHVDLTKYLSGNQTRRPDQILKREPDPIGTQCDSGCIHYLMRDRKDDAAPVIYAFPGCRSDFHHGHIHHILQTGGTGIHDRIYDTYPVGPAKL